MTATPLRIEPTAKARKGTVADRFWAKIDRRAPDDCWEWQAGLRRGYGLFWLDGTNCPAHRAAYAMSVGEIPVGLVVRHRCDNPLCCNPAHLELGTPADNIRDREERGRSDHPKGERHGSCKLTEEQVLEIRARTDSHAAVAADYGVRSSTVQRIRTRGAWSHLPGPIAWTDNRRAS